MFSPLGTSGTYADTGSLNFSLPSWASSTINAAVMVLVLDAMRKCVFASGGVCAPISVVPTATSKFPCGVRSTTTAPGTFSSFANPSTTARNASRSMVFNADPVGTALAAVAVVGAEDDVAGSVAVEQLAINSATHAINPATRMNWAGRV